MTRPVFTAPLIDELRKRVIAHNETSEAKVKLGELRKMYERGYKGDKPAARALRKVDDHLQSLAKAFDPDKHPRRPDGKFGAEQKPDVPSLLDAAASHARRAADAASDAAGATAAGVKRGLHHAAYIHGFADTPPIPAGTKIPKAPLGLPADKHQHQALQAVNAGYSAFTSDVIPERRFEMAGDLARSAVALAGGGVVAHVLTTKKPGGRAQKALVHIAAATPALAAKLAAGIPLHTLAVGYELAAKRLNKDPLRGRRWAYQGADAASRAVYRGTSFAINQSIRGARFGAGKFVDIVEGMPSPNAPKPPPITMRRFRTWQGAKSALGQINREIALRGTRPIRRASAIAALAIPPAMLINHMIAGSPFDPAKTGASYDQFTYRVVNKALGLPETQALQKAMTSELRKVSKEALLQEVARALPGLDSGLQHTFERAGSAAVGAGASLAGATVGALAGAGTQAVRNALNNAGGNPYHDAHGRFTSKDDAKSSGIGQAALAGAAIGAAAGGGAAHLRLRAFNQRVFRAAMGHLDNHVQSLVEPEGTPNGSSIIPRVKELLEELGQKTRDLDAGKAAFIQNRIATDDGVNAARESVQRYGDSNPLYYKEKSREAINNYLASILTPEDRFMLPMPGNKELFQMPELRGRLSSYFGHAKKVIDSSTPETFGKLIANLSPERQQTALKFFGLRGKISDEVDKQLASHTKKIDVAHEAVVAKREAVSAAEAVASEKKAIVERFPAEGEERNAALAGHDAAIKAVTTAEKQAGAAQKKLDDLTHNGPEIRSPIHGKPIAPPTPMDGQMVQRNAENKARAAAAAAHEKEISKLTDKYARLIERARDDYAADLKLRHARAVGAFISLGRRAVGVGSITGRGAGPLLEAHANHGIAEATLQAAEKNLSEQRGLLSATNTKIAAARRTKKPVSDQLLTAARDGEKAVKTAEASVSDAGGKLAVAQGAFLKHSDDFIAKYNKFREDSAKSRSFAVLPPGLVEDMTRDLHRAGAAVYDPISRYAIRPSAAGLNHVLSHVGPPTKAFAENLRNQAGMTVQHAFMHRVTREDPVTGTKTTHHVPSPFKILSTIGAGGASLEFLRAYKDYAHAKMKGDHKVKAPTNLQVELRRHPTKENDGLFAVHAADPRNKSERLIVFGHRYEEGRADPINLNPGARLSDVLNHIQNRQNNERGPGDRNGPAPNAGWLDKAKADELAPIIKKAIEDKKTEKISGGGVTVWARRTDDGGPQGTDGSARNSAAGNYMVAYRDKFANGKSHSGRDDLHNALGALFTYQSTILKPSQFYQLLTVYKQNGGKKAESILAPNEDFGSSDPIEVKGALDAEITRIMDKATPRNDTERDNLRKVVAVVGAAKKIPADQLEPIYAKIGAGVPEREAQAALPTPNQFSKPVHVHRTAEVKPAVPDEIDLPLEAPRDFASPYYDQADETARIVAPRVGISRDSDKDMLSTVIAAYIRTVSKATGYDIPTSAKIVGDAMIRQGGGDRNAQAEFRAAIAGTDPMAFTKTINQAVRRHRHEQKAAGDDYSVQKADTIIGADLDDLDVLMKRMPMMNVGNGATSGATSGATQAPVYHPVADGVAAAADLAGAAVANHAIGHVFKVPEIAPKQVFGALKAPVQTLKAGVGAVSAPFAAGAGAGFKALGGSALTVGKLGLKGLAAGTAGGLLYNAAQGALGGQQYRRNTTPGETVAMGLGNFAASTAGETVGEAVGTLLAPGIGTVAGGIIGGAAGGALGELAGHIGYKTAQKAFAGYNPASVARIMKTKLTPPAPNQEFEAQLGEIGGGVVGNSLGGGAAGEGLGSTVGAVTGILHAKAADASAVLSRRPNQAPSDTV